MQMVRYGYNLNMLGDRYEMVLKTETCEEVLKSIGDLARVTC